MSEYVPVTEVFTDVEADPDAIIAAYGAESIEDLIDGPGDHDPISDERLDGDVEAAADRLLDLADVRLDEPSSATDETTPQRDHESVDNGKIHSTVDVLPGDGQTIEEFLGLTDPEPTEPHTRDGLVLRGPEPSTTRLSNDAFGGPVDDPTLDAERTTMVFEWAS